jgi:hypothetical protein
MKKSWIKLSILLSMFGAETLGIITLSSCKTSINSSDSSVTNTTNSAYLTKIASLTANSIGSGGGTTVTFAAATGMGYDKVTVDQGQQFLAANICSSATIFGLKGGASCLGSVPTTLVPIDTLLQSNINRTLATSQVKQIQEVIAYAGVALPAGYRDIPLIAQDDDGFTGANVTYAARPGGDCGLAGSLPTRITSCNLSWDGNSQGNMGFGLWKLVTRSGANNEVWQDQRTGLIWSSLVGNTNWCQAAGNADAGDISGYCRNTTYQPYYVGNNNIGLSSCAEGGTDPAASAEAVATTLGNAWSGTYLPQKGGMGLLSTPVVRWRLPTRSDYLQAEVDGIRFVMPDMGSSGAGGIEWTGTFMSATRNVAHTFLSDFGYLASTTRTANHLVRCVGH